MSLVPVPYDLTHQIDGDWWLWQTWRHQGMAAELWHGGKENHDRALDSPVRVTCTVPHAFSPLEPFGWTRWSLRRRTEAELQLVDGLEIVIEGHDVVMCMPKRGWSRDDRRVFISIDSHEYVARPRAWASTQLNRPDGSPVARYNQGRARLATDITPVEMTVAALLKVGDFYTRMVHQPINAV